MASQESEDKSPTFPYLCKSHHKWLQPSTQQDSQQADVILPLLLSGQWFPSLPLGLPGPRKHREGPGTCVFAATSGWSLARPTLQHLFSPTPPDCFLGTPSRFPSKCFLHAQVSSQTIQAVYLNQPWSSPRENLFAPPPWYPTTK